MTEMQGCNCIDSIYICLNRVLIKAFDEQKLTHLFITASKFNFRNEKGFTTSTNMRCKWFCLSSL